MKIIKAIKQKVGIVYNFAFNNISQLTIICQRYSDADCGCGKESAEDEIFDENEFDSFLSEPKPGDLAPDGGQSRNKNPFQAAVDDAKLEELLKNLMDVFKNSLLDGLSGAMGNIKNLANRDKQCHMSSARSVLMHGASMGDTDVSDTAFQILDSLTEQKSKFEGLEQPKRQCPY